MLASTSDTKGIGDFPCEKAVTEVAWEPRPRVSEADTSMDAESAEEETSLDPGGPQGDGNWVGDEETPARR